jgi:arginyl-tRNA synthetase
MYAYARAHSILAKAAERGLTPATTPTDLSEVERSLARIMNRLPELVLDMARDYGVHRLTFFGQELAKTFTEFYEAERIIDLPLDQAQHKLLVVRQFIVFMDVYWGLLGIEPQQRMEPQAQSKSA